MVPILELEQLRSQRSRPWPPKCQSGSRPRPHRYNPPSRLLLRIFSAPPAGGVGSSV